MKHSDIPRQAVARELPRFVAVGGLCFLLNTLVLFAGTEWLHLPYVVSLLACYVLVTAIGFLLNAAVTFKAPVARRPDRWLRSYVAMALSLALSLGLFYAAIDLLGVHYLIANVGVTAIVFVVNYLTSRAFVFAGQ